MRGREIFFELVEKADIAADKQGPGTLEQLELGYEALSGVDPGIVLAGNKGFGTFGS